MPSANFWTSRRFAVLVDEEHSRRDMGTESPSGDSGNPYAVIAFPCLLVFVIYVSLF